MPIARQWLSKCYVTTAMLTYAMKEKLLEAVFCMRSATMAMSHYNKAAARNVVSCAVRAEAITRIM
jgi:hypothetical protein